MSAKVFDFRKEKRKRRRKKRPWQWCIDSWTRNIIAPRDLKCYRCIFPIWAGDQCVREIWVRGGKLEVRHIHYYGACPEDPTEEDRKREEENQENKLQNVA
jgi:hypothetical protein